MKFKIIKSIFSNKKGFSPIFVTLIIFSFIASGLATGGIWWWHKEQIKKQNEETERKIFEIKNRQRERNENREREKNKKSELKEVDKNWNLYTNFNLGFSLKVPKFNYSPEGSCKWVGGNDNSYRLENALVPVVYFEEDDNVYIAPSFYYKLIGEKKYGSGNKGYTYKYSQCKKITTNLELLENNQEIFQKGWKITIKKVYSEKDLEKIIKEKYGKGCSIGSKKASSSQEGVFDIEIKGDGNNFEESECPLNYRYTIKYFPQKNLVAYWNLGQAYSFLNILQIGLDEEMVESFKFN